MPPAARGLTAPLTPVREASRPPDPGEKSRMQRPGPAYARSGLCIRDFRRHPKSSSIFHMILRIPFSANPRYHDGTISFFLSNPRRTNADKERVQVSVSLPDSLTPTHS